MNETTGNITKNKLIFKGDFDWKTWAWKGIKKAAAAGVAVALLEFANYIQISDLPTGYAAIGAIIVLILEQAANAIKHA